MHIFLVFMNYYSFKNVFILCPFFASANNIQRIIQLGVHALMGSLLTEAKMITL